MIESDFSKPTTGEIIEFLAQFPPDTPFNITDPDTGWRWDNFTLTQEPCGVWASTDYSIMGREDAP